MFYIVLIWNVNLLGQKIPVDVKSIVVYIFLEKDGSFVPNGTGFILGVPDSTKLYYYTYLITANHVLKDSKDYYQNIYLRFNKKDSLYTFKKQPLNYHGRNKNIFVHDDPSVDIAVIPIRLDENIIDFKLITVDLIPNKEELNGLGITEGTDVFFTGLFANYFGKKRNYPIFRFGRVALFTDEKINWDGLETKLHLIEANSFGGNSGSPVFFYYFLPEVKGQLGPSPKIFKLAGIMKGRFNDYSEIEMIDTELIPMASYNNGISAVVPSYFLLDILFSEELIRLRGY